MSEVCMQYVSVKILHYELVLKTDGCASSSNAFICSVSLYSHWYVSLFHFSPFPLPRLFRNINPDLWICFLPTILFMGRNTLLYMSIHILSRVLRWPEHPQEQLKLWELPNVQLL